MARHTHLDAANAAELQANAQNVISLVHAARPKNTSKGYEPKQQEFKVGSSPSPRMAIVMAMVMAMVMANPPG